MNKAVDDLGNELKVGDKVLYVRLKHRDFQIGTIVKITKYMLQIQENKDEWILKQDHYGVINLSTIQDNISDENILKFINGER